MSRAPEPNPPVQPNVTGLWESTCVLPPPYDLRDLFAMAALNAIIINNQTLRADILKHTDTDDETATAHYAYRYADAMLTTSKEPPDDRKG